MVRVTLIRLRAEVRSPAAWLMMDQVWNWALDEATKAPRLLDEAGAAALPEIHSTFKKLQPRLGTFKEGDCAKLFEADAEDLVDELLCHVERVVTATATAPQPPLPKSTYKGKATP